MATVEDIESLDEEVKELLKNYKFKKPTFYEPCTLKNFKDCLIGLSEEFGLLNINYTFNPYIDVEDNTLRLEALVNLINSVWTLLQVHKINVEKTDRLLEQNHILEQNSQRLNGFASRLKEKLNVEKNEARACVASAQRISDRSDEVLQKLTETQTKLTQVTKQKNSNERSLRNEITRLKLQNEKLLNRLKNKPGTHTHYSEVCDASLLRLKERDSKQQAVIAKLQANNQELLREVVSMKEELILEGILNFKLENGSK